MIKVFFSLVQLGKELRSMIRSQDVQTHEFFSPQDLTYVWIEEYNI